MKPAGIYEQVQFLLARVQRQEATILAYDRALRELQERCDSLARAQALQSPKIAPEKRRMAEIAAGVAAANGLTLAELRSKNKSFAFSHPRQHAMTLMRDAGHSASAIALFFKCDHTTVIHGVRAAKARAERIGRDA
jgi:chromosomal replication initiation ATPase DnaA